MVGQVIFGVAVMLVAGALAAYNLRLKRRGHRTTGVVADVEREYDHNPDTPGYRNWPVLEFQTDRGQDVRTRTKVSGNAQVGQQVRVLYDPDNPNTAEIDTIWGRGTMKFGAFAVIGLLIIVDAIIRSR